MTTLVFDIETVPDIELGRQVLGLEGLADGQVAKAMFAHARQHGGSEFLPHEQHRIVAISCVLRRGDSLKVWSLGEPRPRTPGWCRRCWTASPRPAMPMSSRLAGSEWHATLNQLLAIEMASRHSRPS